MKSQSQSEVLAVVVHAFYPDVFVKIIKSLTSISTPLKLYVTTTRDHEVEVNRVLESSGLKFYVLPVENHGRDVLPFFMIMPEVVRADHDVILKLHTKKTSHRGDGDAWMDDILNKLVLKSNVSKCLGFIQKNRDVGMISPAGHIIPISKYLGSNEHGVINVAKRLGVSKGDVMNEVFSAGTMFYARVSAMLPIINLGFTSEAFEEEKGQVDGTLAHAIERCFSISCFSAQLRLISTDTVFGNVSQSVQDEYTYADARSYGEDASIVVKVFHYALRPKKLLIKIKNMILR